MVSLLHRSLYKEVNNLTHRESATWTGRTVPFDTAIRGLRETLDLFDIWAPCNCDAQGKTWHYRRTQTVSMRSRFSELYRRASNAVFVLILFARCSASSALVTAFRALNQHCVSDFARDRPIAFHAGECKGRACVRSHSCWGLSHALFGRGHRMRRSGEASEPRYPHSSFLDRPDRSYVGAFKQFAAATDGRCRRRRPLRARRYISDNPVCSDASQPLARMDGTMPPSFAGRPRRASKGSGMGVHGESRREQARTDQSTSSRGTRKQRSSAIEYG